MSDFDDTLAAGIAEAVTVCGESVTITRRTARDYDTSSATPSATEASVTLSAVVSSWRDVRGRNSLSFRRERKITFAEADLGGAAVAQGDYVTVGSERSEIGEVQRAGSPSVMTLFLFQS